MLRYKHLKPWLVIYLVTSLLLSFSAIGITVIIILNEINGFSLSSVQFLSCSLYTSNKVNTYLEIILQLCFIMSIGVIVLGLGQFFILIWQFILLRKETEEKGDDEDNLFQDLSFGKLIFLYVLNGLGFMCLVPIVGSFLTLYIQLSTCTNPSDDKSSSYFIPTAIATGCLLFQIFSWCMLVKLVYHFEQKQSESQKEKRQKGNQKQNKYKFDQKDKYTDPRWEEKNRELEEIERMRRRIEEARKQITNNSMYNENAYLSSSTGQGSPRPLERSLLSKQPRNSPLSPENSLYDNPGIIGHQSGSSKLKLPKDKRSKYGGNKSNKPPNKYSHNPTTAQNGQSNSNSPNQLNPQNQLNQINYNTNNPKITISQSNSLNQTNQSNNENSIIQNNSQNGTKLSNKNNSINSVSLVPQQNSVLPPKNSQNQGNHQINSTQNPQNLKQTAIKQSEAKNPSGASNKQENKQMTAQKISQKQKQLMRTLPKNPYKKNVPSKHLPSSVIFEQPGSQEEGSEFLSKPLISNSSNPNNQPSNSKSQGKNSNQLNPNKSQDMPKGISSIQSISNNKQQIGYPSKSSNESPNLSPSFSPINGPQNSCFDFQSDQINLNEPLRVKQPNRIKYLNSPYLKNLKNKNISPEKRRNIKRPFLKIAGNVVQFDAKNYQVTDTNFNAQNINFPLKQSKRNLQKDKINQDPRMHNQDPSFSKLLLPLHNNSTNTQPFQNNQINPQTNSPNNHLHLKSQRKSRNSEPNINSILKGILDAQTLQQQNPIIDYIQEDQDYDDKIKKILDYEKISKKRRRYIYNPFETENKNNEKLYLHKNKSEKALMLTQNLQSSDCDPFRDEDFDNVNFGKMTIEDDGHGNPVLKLDRGNIKSVQNGQSQVKKNKKEAVLIDFIRSKHVID